METKTGKTGTGTVVTETVLVEEVPAPVVIDLRRNKKKAGKKRYRSQYSRSLSELESGVTRSARRVAKAVHEAIDRYQDERDKSAERKRDGALLDMLRNQSKALREGLPVAAQAPSDFLDAVADMKVVRKFLRR